MKDYPQYLEEKGYSENTIKSHSYYARKFKRFLKHQSLEIENIKTNDLYCYLEQARLKKEKSTYNTELSSIKILFRYLSEQYSNPELMRPAQIKSLKFKKLPRSTSLKAVFKIEMLLKNSTKLENYEKIILLLILNHGMNPMDIIDLKITDMDFKESAIAYSKNHQKVYIKLFSDDEVHFFNYFKSNHHKINDQLLIDIKSKKIKKHHIYKVFKKIESYDIHTNPTELRNRFILDSLNVGIPAIYVAKYIGVSNLNQIFRFESLTDDYILNGKIEINKLRLKEGKLNGERKRNRRNSEPIRITVKRTEDTDTRNTAKQVYN